MSLLDFRFRKNFGIIACCLVLCLFSGIARAEDVDPFPPAPVLGEVLAKWTFEGGDGGWQAAHDCRTSVGQGLLRIASDGPDPFLIVRLPKPVPGPVMAILRMRSKLTGTGQFFWSEAAQGGFAEQHSGHFDICHDGQWQTYSVPLNTAAPVASLRLDPGNGLGEAEVESIVVRQLKPYPVLIESISTDSGSIAVGLRNRSAEPRTVALDGRSEVIAANQCGMLRRELAGKEPFELVSLAIAVEGFPPLERTIVVHRPAATDAWPVCRGGSLVLRVAPDGSGAAVERNGSPVAVIAPLAMRKGEICRLKVVKQQEGRLRLAGQQIELDLAVIGDEIRYSLDASEPLEGPVVRPLGGLEQGLFAGVEYLGKGEKSSSTLDIETEEHLRFAPDPLKVTMPLLACVTDRASVALSWNDMSLQPTYASPNFLDGMAGEHRMSLRGKRIDAAIRVAGGDLEDAILWAVRRSGLPPLPASPRDPAAQRELCLAAFRGPVQGEGGWGHCAEPNYKRQPFSDVASAIWHLTGQVPALDRLVPSGGHIRDDAGFFVTGRAAQWLDLRRKESQHRISIQQPDGSFRYQGPYQRGHYEDTASGWCATHTTHLLEFAWQTGDRAALEAGLKSLEYMKRFREPRGAQSWELSLHTPDVLASAYLVWAYVRGYELTGKQEYLDLARRWAITGIPFVYLWDKYPVMRYATTPVYGASGYRSPVWIGLPVQWCGGVYAYALTLLAAHDETLDWRHLARGIYVACQQIQYPEGPRIGCLPDVFKLPTQQRDGPSINPSAIVALQRALDGQPVCLAVAADGKHRVASPYAVTLRANEARIEAVAGASYQLLIDGRVIDVRTSKGSDILQVAESLRDSKPPVAK